MATTSPELASWAGLALESFEPHRLSPRPRDQEVGVRIQAPSRVVQGEPVRIAGFIAFTGEDLLLPSPWTASLTFVASSGPWLASGHWHASGKPVETSPPFGGRPLRADQLTHRTTEYFTLELSEVLEEAVPLGVTYVFVFLGRHVSNVVRVHVEHPEAP